MIRLQGKYRLTFPVTPGEVQFKGYGSDVEATTSITLDSLNRYTGRKAKSIAFEFLLPGDPENPLVEVEGYQGPREWLAGLDRLSHAEVLLTINELNLAWNVLIGPCEGKFSGINGSFRGTIEFPIYIKSDFVSWSNSKQVLQPSKVITKQTSKRANTTGKKAKKKVSLIEPAVQEQQKQRINQKLTGFTP
ncbi:MULTISPECIES: hypothetical protein [Bacillales]|uniref:hypothetical protein n=1 Tax=Bacillales TaxID=1385 RepID=UPI0003495AB9|nr:MULTISPECIES: hypothetical protein [Bacillales]KMZ42506.1 hypothetical protein AC624_16015 [Bacillus sp. FJAT-27238]